MSDRQLAEAMGIDRTLVWRVRKGERGINQAFITGARRAFPSWGLDDLFYTESEEKAAS